MRKFLKVTLIVAAAFVFFASCKSLFGEQYAEEKEGTQTSIHWEYVNLREDHSQKSNVVAVLHEGNSITLTGYSYEYMSGEGLPQESWTKVITEDGQTGWIVTESIQW